MTQDPIVAVESSQSLGLHWHHIFAKWEPLLHIRDPQVEQKLHDLFTFKSEAPCSFGFKSKAPVIYVKMSKVQVLLNRELLAFR